MGFPHSGQLGAPRPLPGRSAEQVLRGLGTGGAASCSHRQHSVPTSPSRTSPPTSVSASAQRASWSQRESAQHREAAEGAVDVGAKPIPASLVGHVRPCPPSPQTPSASPKPRPPLSWDHTSCRGPWCLRGCRRVLGLRSGQTAAGTTVRSHTARRDSLGAGPREQEPGVRSPGHAPGFISFCFLRAIRSVSRSQALSSCFAEARGAGVGGRPRCCWKPAQRLAAGGRTLLRRLPVHRIPRGGTEPDGGRRSFPAQLLCRCSGRVPHLAAGGRARSPSDQLPWGQAGPGMPRTAKGAADLLQVGLWLETAAPCSPECRGAQPCAGRWHTQTGPRQGENGHSACGRPSCGPVLGLLSLRAEKVGLRAAMTCWWEGREDPPLLPAWARGMPVCPADTWQEGLCLAGGHLPSLGPGTAQRREGSGLSLALKRVRAQALDPESGPISATEDHVAEGPHTQFGVSVTGSRPSLRARPGGSGREALCPSRARGRAGYGVSAAGPLAACPGDGFHCRNCHWHLARGGQGCGSAGRSAQDSPPRAAGREHSPRCRHAVDPRPWGSGLSQTQPAPPKEKGERTTSL